MNSTDAFLFHNWGPDESATRNLHSESRASFTNKDSSHKFEVTHSTDAFLSYNWAPDVSDSNNHHYVSIADKEFKELSYQTWFDVEQIMNAFGELILKETKQTKCLVACMT